MTVSILGVQYQIHFRNFSSDPYFAKQNLSGYCSPGTKEIIVCNMSTAPSFSDESSLVIDSVEKETLRHEIIHAFLFESGLFESSNSTDGPWAMNEEMVDWFAMQGPKIWQAWLEVDALP